MSKLAHTIGIGTLAAQAAGCVIHTTDRDGSGGAVGDDVAAISARWSLHDVGDGAVTACPAGFDTVALIAQQLDDAGQPRGAASSDLFDCEARVGESRELAPGVYRAWIEVRSHDLGALYAQSLAQVLDVRKLGQALAVDVLNDGGYFQLSWELTGASSSRPVDCTAIGGPGTVHLIGVNIADAQRIYEDRWTCSDHTAVSGGLLQGSYTVTIDAQADDMSVGPVLQRTDQTIAGQNHITDLGHITIPVDGL